MTEPMNCILIDAMDDVATALVDLSPGDVGRFVASGAVVEVVVTGNVPQYHKFAVHDIRRTELVRKYGAAIGQATQNICKGAHVHMHNIISPER